MTVNAASRATEMRLTTPGIGIVHRLLMFLSARYISLKTASSFGNSERFFGNFRSASLGNSIVFVV